MPSLEIPVRDSPTQQIGLANILEGPPLKRLGRLLEVRTRLF